MIELDEMMNSIALRDELKEKKIDETHPWHEFYNSDSSKKSAEGMSPMFSKCTLGQVQRFRNITKDKWVDAPRMINTADYPKSTYNTSTQFPVQPFAFYSIISSRGNVLILTPVFNEVVAHDRLDLRLIHMNKNARDTMNPGRFDPQQHNIGDVLCITRLHRKKRGLNGSRINQFKPKDVFKAGGKHFWEVAEYHPAPKTIVNNVLTSPYRLLPDKFLCIAANFSQVIEMPIWPGIFINQLLSTTIFVPSIKPGQFLSTLKKEEWLTVAKISPKLTTSNTYAPIVVFALGACQELKNIFNNSGEAFKFWNREHAYKALNVAVNFGSNGFSAMRNSQIDTHHYITRISRYYIHHPYVYFNFTLVGANCSPPVAKWNRAVSIRILCEANLKFFYADVMSARKSSGLTLDVRARASLQSFDESLKNQNVVVFQRRDFKASEINYDIEKDSHADKLIQALYGGPPLPEVHLPKIDPPQFGEITLLETQTKYAQMVSNPYVSALIGSSSFGCGKTVTIAAAALHSRKKNDAKQLQMITAITNSAVVAVIEKLVQLDPNVRIVRVISSLNASQLPSTELSAFDYPTVLADLLMGEVMLEDRLVSPTIQNEQLCQMMSYLKYRSLLSKSSLTNKRLQILYDQSEGHNEEILLNFYMKVKKPNIVVGTFQSICNAFTSSWQPYINSIATLQIDEASTLPRESILQLVTLFPNARYSLVGDYRQLSPYYENGASALLIDAAVGDTLRECVTKNILPSVYFNGVFRCRPELTELLGDMFYDSSLQSLHKKSIAEDQMEQCPAWKLQTANNQYPIVFINTEGTTHRPRGTSLRNIDEANVAMDLARHLLKFVDKEDIAILCFYKAQMNEMRVFGANSGIYVGSIDSAQGREWPVCIICTTRTDTFVGSRFLTSSNRINVALSRSKHLNFIFGHVSSMRNAIYWGDVVYKCEEKRTLVRAEEFNHIINTDLCSITSDDSDYQDAVEEL